MRPQEVQGGYSVRAAVSLVGVNRDISQQGALWQFGLAPLEGWNSIWFWDGPTPLNNYTDEGVRGTPEGQAREHRQAARHRGGAGGPRQGHRHGTLHG